MHPLRLLVLVVALSALGFALQAPALIQQQLTTTTEQASENQ